MQYIDIYCWAGLQKVKWYIFRKEGTDIVHAGEGRGEGLGGGVKHVPFNWMSINAFPTKCKFFATLRADRRTLNL